MTIQLTLPDHIVALLERIADALERRPQRPGEPTRLIATNAPVEQKPVEAQPSEPAAPVEQKAADPILEELTERHWKEAVHRKRLDIEGFDYETNPTSDGYRRYHSAITQACRGIAQQLSGGKATRPSDLDKTLWPNLISCINELYVDKEGKLRTLIDF